MTRTTVMKPTTQASANHQRSRKPNTIAPRKNCSNSHRRQQMDHKPLRRPRHSDSLEGAVSVRIRECRLTRHCTAAARSPRSAELQNSCRKIKILYLSFSALGVVFACATCGFGFRIASSACAMTRYACCSAASPPR